MAEKKERNYTKEQDDKLIPVAREMLLALAAQEDLMIGSSETVKIEEVTAYYQQRYLKTAIPILLKHDVKITEVSYVFQLLGQPINFLQEVTSASLAMNRDLSDALLYGVEDIRDLTLSQLDKKMKDNSKEKGLPKK